MELDFDTIFKITTRALNINRSHPYIPRDMKWILQFFIIHGIYTLAFVNIVYNIICHNLKANDFSQTCKNAILCVVYSVITMQYGILLWHQDSIAGLINDIKKDYEQSNDLNSVEKDMLHKYANQGVWVSKQWFVVALNGPTLFIGKSIIIMLYSYYINEFRLVAMFDMVYPSIIEENKDNIYVYLLTYALMVHFGFYSTIMYIAFVPLGPIFMLHACGQLELVENQIADLFVEFDDLVIKKKLKRIIMQLQYIDSFVDRINQIFKIAYEVTLKGSTIMLPVTLYEVLEAFKNGEVSIEFITFLVGGTLISSSPCYYSDLLMEKGEKVRLSLYTCGWELYYDRRTRTTLQLMLQHALKPIAIRTIFTTLCLEALTDNWEANNRILTHYTVYNVASFEEIDNIWAAKQKGSSSELFHQSYALFNLMNAMWS